MELFSTEGLSSWEAAGENIPDGMYTLIEFDEDIWRMVRHLPKSIKGYRHNRHTKSKVERSFLY